MSEPSRVIAAASACLEAALDPVQWEEALTRFSRSVGARGAVFVPESVQSTTFPMIPTRSLVEPFADYVQGGWRLVDFRIQRISRLRPRKVLVEDDISTTEEQGKHPYFQDFLRPHRLKWWAGINCIIGHDQWTLSILREANTKPFDHLDVAQLQKVHPMFERSLAISEIAARLRATAIGDAYGSIGKSAVVFGWKGEILAATPDIDAVLSPFVTIRSGRLVAPSDARQKELDAMLSSALRPQLNDRRVALAWREGVSDVIVIRAVSLIQRTSLYPGCRVAFLIDRLKSDVTVPKAVVRTLFKLTPAETELVTLLAKGLSLSACAESLDLTRETARTRLKSILHKTDTARQSQLVMLMMKISAL